MGAIFLKFMAHTCRTSKFAPPGEISINCCVCDVQITLYLIPRYNSRIRIGHYLLRFGLLLQHGFHSLALHRAAARRRARGASAPWQDHEKNVSRSENHREKRAGEITFVPSAIGRRDTARPRELGPSAAVKDDPDPASKVAPRFRCVTRSGARPTPRG